MSTPPRLLPLLFLVIVIVAIKLLFEGGDMWAYGKQLTEGVIGPSLPNGGWSITVELHFYLILPLLLFFCRSSPALLLVILALAILGRAYLYHRDGSVQWFAYWTIIGRIDQFLFGILAFQYRRRVVGQHRCVAVAMIGFLLFYWHFDRMGGMLQMGTYPSPAALWIILPTIEALAYSLLIAYYDNTFKPTNGLISGFVARVGQCSYSIYLLHFFFVFWMARFVNERIMDISYFYAALPWAAISFLMFVPLAWLSYTFVEKPFLRIRVPYLRE
ncbi:acyltransferase [Phyllobacterium sp. 628]|uniref:acyltransferase family protein n=1 Tax=Phyllobacterium sp. 628 TaxID=2718938 RepID=UPI0016627CD3|nr:acyltransferase [Phyllobacterium sp. 628]QND50988.1 acyltransferase [Phyllobacterium sp. 628]